MRRRKRRHDPHRNHFQRVHEHTTRGAERADPEQCACGGRGWILSSCDVWEKCSRHYSGQEHPEHVISEEREKEQHEIHKQICREKRTDDPREAHEEALQEKRRRESEEELPREIAGEEPTDGAEDEDPELPF